MEPLPRIGPLQVLFSDSLGRPSEHSIQRRKKKKRQERVVGVLSTMDLHWWSANPLVGSANTRETSVLSEMCTEQNNSKSRSESGYSSSNSVFSFQSSSSREEDSDDGASNETGSEIRKGNAVEKTNGNVSLLKLHSDSYPLGLDHVRGSLIARGATAEIHLGCLLEKTEGDSYTQWSSSGEVAVKVPLILYRKHAKSDSTAAHERKKTRKSFQREIDIFTRLRGCTNCLQAIAIVEGLEGAPKYRVGRSGRIMTLGQLRAIEQSLKNDQSTYPTKYPEYAVAEIEGLSNSSQVEDYRLLPVTVGGVRTTLGKIMMMHPKPASMDEPTDEAIVMQYVNSGSHIEANTLVEARQGGYLPTNEESAIKIIQQVLLAVGEMHRRGVVHSDIKPDNILYDTMTGDTIVADFGLAKVMDADGKVGDPHGGTVGFMAPEVWQVYKSTDPRTIYNTYLGPPIDMYSIGALMVWLATNEYFDEGSLGLLELEWRIRTCEISLTDNFKVLVRPLLDPNPNKRPSAEEMLCRLKVKETS